MISMLELVKRSVGVAEHEGAISEDETTAMLEWLTAMARRDWAVRLLDAIGRNYPGAGWRMADLGEDMTPTCVVYPTVRTEDARHYTSGSEDAARLAAADATLPELWPLLTDEQRAEIGERP